MTGAVGLITEPRHANEIVTGGCRSGVHRSGTAAGAVLGANGAARTRGGSFVAGALWIRRKAMGEVTPLPRLILRTSAVPIVCTTR
jgi:hypothetical protein